MTNTLQVQDDVLTNLLASATLDMCVSLSSDGSARNSTAAMKLRYFGQLGRNVLGTGPTVTTTPGQTSAPQRTPTPMPSQSSQGTEAPRTTLLPTNILGWCNGFPANDSRACSGNGQCNPNSANTASVCVCNQGYIGEKCSNWRCGGVLKNSTAVCSGHGTCVAPDTCKCDASFAGDNCQGTPTPVGQSTPPPRENGNTPTPGPMLTTQPPQTTNVPKTTAPPSASPKPLGMCNGYPSNDTRACSNHGQCVPNASNNASVCACERGFLGEKCAVWQCAGIWNTMTTACSGHGQCVAPDTCKCSAAYVGETCERATAQEGTPVPTQNPPKTTTAPPSGTPTAGVSQTTAAPKYQCFGKASTDSSACSANGICAGADQCNCNDQFIGRQCEISVKGSATTFVSLDSATVQDVFDTGLIDTVPAASAALTVSIGRATGASASLSASFAGTGFDRKAICLKPQMSISNKTIFIASSAGNLPRGSALEYWLSGLISVSIKQGFTTYQTFELSVGDRVNSANAALSLNTDYIVLIGTSGLTMTAQLVRTVSVLLALI